MVNDSYKRQVSLLLNVLPEVAKEKCFALHGGTAINLFIQNMPRLSVDIDLTYLPIEDRSSSLSNISSALQNIKTSIQSIIPDAKIVHQEAITKLQINHKGTQIKIEVNQTNRGALEQPMKLMLCDKAQEDFDAFCAIQVVETGQLYGGKICAALDRQHPRDLFDVKYFLRDNDFTKEVKAGFILCLLSSNRPINELLFPHFLDQQQAMTNQFNGMSFDAFNYRDFESTRETLLSKLHASLTIEDKLFLVSIKSLTPNWAIYDFERFPAIKWKLSNLQKLKEQNPSKHEEQLNLLRSKLEI